MNTERIEVSRRIAADPSEVFSVLTDPEGHVAIDASGMLMSVDGEPVTAVGDSFVVHMDREALGDNDMGLYDVTVTIEKFEVNREISWGISSNRGRIGHIYGYRIEPADGKALVTSYCDWSGIPDEWKASGRFPIISDSALKGTLGILDRTVKRGYPRGPF